MSDHITSVSSSSTRTDPAMEGDPTDAQLGGQRSYLDTTTSVEPRHRQFEGVERRDALVGAGPVRRR